MLFQGVLIGMAPFGVLATMGGMGGCGIAEAKAWKESQ